MRTLFLSKMYLPALIVSHTVVGVNLKVFDNLFDFTEHVHRSSERGFLKSKTSHESVSAMVTKSTPCPSTLC